MTDWKDLVRNVAPMLGTALGGPLAGTAVKVLAAELLGDEKASEKQIEEAVLSASPEQLLQLRAVDNNFELQMKELDIDIVSIDAANTNSARDMAKINMWPQIVLSTIFVVGYFIIVYFLIVNPMELPNSVLIVVGVITAAIPQILNFWFGSTQSSKEKTDILKVIGTRK